MADRGQGYKYQLSVTAYLASLLSKDETVQDYHIFYEVQQVEPFDDIVLAVQYNDSDDFRLYLVQVKSDYGADVNFLGEFGLTPLYAAAMKGNPEIIKTLLRYGPKSDIETCGNTLLYKAIQSGYSKMVKLLLNRKYSPIFKNYEIIQRIYRNLANANAVYEFGLTPLHLATKAGYRLIVWTLLHCNADSNQIDEHGRTALHYAVEMGKTGIISDLLHKADASIKDENGLTPLDYAKLRECSDIIELLSSN